MLILQSILTTRRQRSPRGSSLEAQSMSFQSFSVLGYDEKDLEVLRCFNLLHNAQDSSMLLFQFEVNHRFSPFQPSICLPIGMCPNRSPPARKAWCKVSTRSWPRAQRTPWKSENRKKPWLPETIPSYAVRGTVLVKGLEAIFDTELPHCLGRHRRHPLHSKVCGRIFGCRGLPTEKMFREMSGCSFHDLDDCVPYKQVRQTCWKSSIFHLA